MEWIHFVALGRIGSRFSRNSKSGLGSQLLDSFCDFHSKRPFGIGCFQTENIINPDKDLSLKHQRLKYWGLPWGHRLPETQKYPDVARQDSPAK